MTGTGLQANQDTHYSEVVGALSAQRPVTDEELLKALSSALSSAELTLDRAPTHARLITEAISGEAYLREAQELARNNIGESLSREEADLFYAAMVWKVSTTRLQRDFPADILDMVSFTDSAGKSGPTEGIG